MPLSDPPERTLCLMPTLTRLIIILAVIAACIYAGMLALVTWVQPVTTEVTIRIPAHIMLQQPVDNSLSSPAPAANPYTTGEPEAEPEAEPEPEPEPQNAE